MFYRLKQRERRLIDPGLGANNEPEKLIWGLMLFAPTFQNGGNVLKFRFPSSLSTSSFIQSVKICLDIISAWVRFEGRLNGR
jgi:hypothetical protein